MLFSSRESSPPVWLCTGCTCRQRRVETCSGSSNALHDVTFVGILPCQSFAAVGVVHEDAVLPEYAVVWPFVDDFSALAHVSFSLPAAISAEWVFTMARSCKALRSA